MAEGFVQRVIIPKGLVNPNETTIVEIPGAYKNAQAVVAKPKTGGGIKNLSQFSYPSSSSAPSSPSTPSRKVKKRSYMRKTHPPMGERAGPCEISDLSFAGFTFAGQGNEGLDESSHGFHPYVPKEPFSPDISYRQFLPHAQSTMGDLSYEEGSLYRDFRPKTTATPHVRAKSPGHSPPSMDKYQSGPQSRICRKTSVTRCSPGEYTTEEEITEESYNPYEQSQPTVTSSSGGYEGYPSSGGVYCPGGFAGGTSSEGAGGFTSGGSSGGYMQYSGVDSVSPAGGNVTQADLMNSLGQIEASEMQKIMGDLNNYQSARRRLLFDASSLASAADVSSSILNSGSSSQ